MMTVNPYVSPRTRANPSPSRFRWTARRRQVASVVLAAAAIVCLIMLLTGRSEDADPNAVVPVGFSFWGVAVPAGLSALFGLLSMLVVIPVLLSGILWAFWWLLPVGASVSLFFVLFDWRELYRTGIPSLKINAIADRASMVPIMTVTLIYLVCLLTTFALIHWMERRELAVKDEKIQGEIRKFKSLEAYRAGVPGA